MRLSFIIILAFVFCFASTAQLLPHIGLNSQPLLTDVICEIPLYEEPYELVGYDEGQFVNDFTLFSAEGIEFTLSEELSQNKPVLLISSSFTCPVYRSRSSIINQIAAEYSDEIILAVIYTVEAHPTDISPYFGYPNPGSANTQLGILYPQPTTYGERIDIVNDMFDFMDIGFPVYVDGPCNAWLETFGPAPNTAYLLNPDGSVYSRHPWFDAYPYDILCDIENILGNELECDDDYLGSFTFTYDSDTISYGIPGETIYVTATLENNSNAPVLIECERMILNLPDFWESSMCLDVCLQPEETYREITLEPGEIMIYTNYFYTAEGSEGLGHAGIRFRNASNPQNRFNRSFYADASDVLSIINEDSNAPFLFPNPTSEYIRLNIPIEGPESVRIFNSSGQMVLHERLTPGNNGIYVEDLVPGLYILMLRNQTYPFIKNL